MRSNALFKATSLLLNVSSKGAEPPHQYKSNGDSTDPKDPRRRSYPDISHPANIPIAPAVKEFMTWATRETGYDIFVDSVQPYQNVHGTGLISTCNKTTNVRAVTVELQKCLTASTMARDSAFLFDYEKLPSEEDIKQIMWNASIHDPMIIRQMHLGVILAIERMNPESIWQPYFNILPHPAIDDNRVDESYKDLLTDAEKEELHDIRQDLGVVMQRIGASLGSKAPPIQVIHWGFRTALQRQLLVPDPIEEMQDRAGFFTRLRTKGTRAKKWFERAKRKGDLVPALVPLIDLTTHDPIPNCNIQLNLYGYGSKDVERVKQGYCVELRTIGEVPSMSPLTITYNKSHTKPMALYRFGFIPE